MNTTLTVRQSNTLLRLTSEAEELSCHTAVNYLYKAASAAADAISQDGFYALLRSAMEALDEAKTRADDRDESRRAKAIGYLHAKVAKFSTPFRPSALQAW